MAELPAPEDIQGWLDRVEVEANARGAVIYDKCPVPAIEKAIELFPDLLSQVCYNKEAPAHLLERAYEELSSFTKTSVVKHKNATAKILAAAVVNPDLDVREAAAAVATDLNQIRRLAKDASMSLRFDLAKNPNTPSEVLADLLEPYYRNVAAQILENPNCTHELFREIAEKPIVDQDDSEISGTWVAEPLLSKAPPEMLEGLFRRFSEKDRQYVILNPNASIAMLGEMFDGIERIYDGKLISNLLKRNDLPDELVLKAIKKVREDLVTIFAGWSGISQAVVEGLYTQKSIDVNLTLIQNPNVTGQMLMPLVKDKSKKIRNALAERTYKVYDEHYRSTDTPYEGRDELWAALDGGVAVKRFEVSLHIVSDPVPSQMPADWIEGWDSVEAFLANGSADSAYPGLQADLQSEMHDSPLAELLETADDAEPDNYGVIALAYEASSFTYYKHVFLDDGFCEILYAKCVDVEFKFQAESLDEVRKKVTESALQLLRVVDGEDTSYAGPIYQIFGTVRLNNEFLVSNEIWFEDKETKDFIESWPN